MLVPPVAQGGPRPSTDPGSRGSQSSNGVGAAATTLWPLAPAQPCSQASNHQATPPLAATPAPAHSQGVSRYGLYSLFPGGGGGSYVAATPTTPGPPTPARAYHTTTHKVSESVFSAAVGVGGYTWGAPTPPPGSPYSPVPVAQLELLAKNLASLAPPGGQQALSFQGVNVGSLHQHTQHTLNLAAGLHHLHHGAALHQNTFSPQLSLVTGNPPTLTINGFSSGSSSAGSIVPTTGVLLQEYQSPTGSTCGGTSSNGNDACSPTSPSNTGTLVVQTGGTTTTTSNVGLATTVKKREAFLPSQGQPVKLENKSRQPCICRNGKTKLVHSDAGCSRTLPVVSSWNGQDQSGSSLVKRESAGASMSCQVAEVSTSLRATTTTAVKIEPVPPKSENGVMVSNAAAGGIPVGIAVARQRLQHQETASSMRNVSLSHQTSSHHTSYHHFQPDNLGSAMAVGGTTVVHCGSGGEERSAHLAIPSGALAPSLNGTTLGSSLNSSLGTSTSATTWPSTLWQYPAAAMPMEPVGFPQMGVGLQGGLQLVRDPGSGQLLLIHATGEQMQQQQQHQQQHHQQQQQQTVVWPNYPSHPGGAPPPLLLPPPPPVPSSSLQLLSDIGGARLVLAAESKRKQQPNLPIVKIEADCAGSPATIITSAESTKALQTVTSMTGTLVPDTPLVTTLHYYPHAPTLLHLGQPEPAHCRSQATSPVSCLTPPPEATPLATVQDASNQTETPEEEVVESVESHVKLERSFSPCQASPKVYDPVPEKTGKALALACKRDRIESPRRCPSSFQDEQTSVKCQDALEEERMAHGPRIIEITEENCDSFHENFEFFNYRKEPLDRRLKQTEEEREQEEARAEVIHWEKPSVEETATVPMEVEPDVVSVEPEVANQWKQNHHSPAQTEPINGLDCTSCKTQKNWICPEGDSRIPVKSFDMPSIDCEEQPEPMVIKRERSDAEECERVSELEPRSQKPRVPKQSVEKFHPCIENVVEKLKKNAAAAVFQQRSAELESQQLPDSTSRQIQEAENGRENNNDPEKMEIDEESVRKVQEVRPEPKKFDCEKKSRQNVDLSGLELLSSSIEQLEHLKPETVDDRSPITPVASKENGGNVDSPLGLLCALAEQRFMEEVGGERRKQPPTPESSEEVSIAGRVLMNLGKTSTTQRSEKRRFQETPGDQSKTKRFKDHQETTSSRFEGNRSVLFREEIAPRCSKARRNIDFSDVDQVNSYRMAEEADEVPNISEELEAESARRGDEEGYYPVEEVLETTDSEAYEPNLPETELSPRESERTILEGKQMGYKEKQREFQRIDSVEMDMRVKMADIQRRYKEKQKELSRLTPKKDERRLSGEFRRQSKSLSRERELISSPVLTHDSKETANVQEEELEEATAPTLNPSVLGMQRCNVNLVKLSEPRSHIKLIDSIPSISIAALPVVSPVTVSSVADDPEEDEDEAEKQTDKPAYDTSSPAPMIASSSSASKKRKVGRPRKLMCSSAGARHLTETIVAKKPKSKSSLVGYLLNSKNKHAQNKVTGKTCATAVPQTNANAKADTQKPSKCKIKPAKQTPLHSKNVISSIIAEKAKLSQEAKLEKQGSKVKPKLKAEPAIKNWNDPETLDWNGAAENIPPEEVIVVPEVKESTPIAEISEVVREKEKHEKSKKKKRKSSSLSPTRRKSSERDKKRRKSSECKECKECAKAAKVERTESIFNRCKLTSAHLAIDQLRVLTAMGGLFYAGRLSAIQAPDVYAITLDGERGNRPHIHSREEILRDAIVEICPSSTKELPPGTRLCAYWSQQYRCLYPGTSVEPSEPDPELDEKFVSVEFDDGDSGRIALDDIRLLQPDYPVVEYDPNPLLSLGKRRRQASASMEDKRSATSTGTTQSTSTNAPNDETLSVSVSSTVNEKTSDHSKHTDAKTLDEYREKKKLKKRRRDKLRKIQEAREGKRKHKRHRCCEEHRKHKHRKHRRHRHKHSHRHCDGGDQLSGGESSSGQKSEEELLSPLREKEADEEEEEEEEEEVVMAKEDALAVEDATAVVEAEEKIEPKSTPANKKADKKAKSRERQESVESRSKMAAFLPARQLWGWAGKGYRRPGAKGRAKKQFFRAIQRGSETIQIGDSAVFLSTGRPDRPYIGKIESMWETSSSNMIVKVKWFYHPEETVGCPTNLAYPGALFESPHMDENDVQTISHKCEVLPLQEYTDKLGKEPHRYLTIYDNNDIYYLAGYYDPTTYLLTLQPGVV